MRAHGTARARFRALAAGLGLLAALLAWSAQPAAAQHATGRAISDVVELFTSQGCSSCPPADAFLGELEKQPGVLVLAYHVDYWDYIGWRDPFGSAENTERQRAYARALADKTVYTPQAIVNGEAGTVGSRKRRIRALMAEGHLPRSKTPAKVDLKLEGDDLKISAERTAAAAAPDGDAALMLVVFRDEVTTEVKRGENAGRTLVNTHPVRGWRVLGMWDGQSMNVDIPVRMLADPADGAFGCAAILQRVTAGGNPGPILSAAALDIAWR